MRAYRPISKFSHNGKSLQAILNNHETYLSKRDIRKTSISWTKQHRADLDWADLSGVNLSGVNLSDAGLFGANLSEANLDHADLSDAWLSKADLMKADLTEANLSHAILSDASLSGAVLRKVNLSDADLSGADLIDADLRDAYLKNANLIDVDLTCAEVSHANLTHSNLSDADLSGACLRSVNLSGADLRRCTLIGADLTGAELSGVCLDEANLSGWIIKGISCSHIIRGKGKEVLRYKPREFEKKYMQMDKLSDFILNIPCNETAYYIGKFIAQSINNVMGSFTIDLKGIEALSNNDTKFVFNIYDDVFFKEKRGALETKAKDALNEFFSHKSVEREDDHFKDVVEEATGRTLRLRTSMPIPLTPLEVVPKEIQDRLVEYYIKLGKVGESIREIVSSIFG